MSASAGAARSGAKSGQRGSARGLGPVVEVRLVCERHCTAHTLNISQGCLVSTVLQQRDISKGVSFQ